MINIYTYTCGHINYWFDKLSDIPILIPWNKDKYELHEILKNL